MSKFNSLPHLTQEEGGAIRAKHAELIGAVNAQTGLVLDDLHQLVNDLKNLESLQAAIHHQDKLEVQIIQAALVVQFDNPASLRGALEEAIKQIDRVNQFRQAEV